MKKRSNGLKEYWTQRYLENRTGWDLGKISNPLKVYFDQLINKNIDILIPGAGNSYEAEYLYQHGFSNVHVVDIVTKPLTEFITRNPTFPKDQLIEQDFFQLRGQFDLIIEQTFFCSFPPHPSMRQQYFKKASQLLNDGGKLVGLWFDIPLTGDMEKRPFGGTEEEYKDYLALYFDIHTFEKCHNSVPSRIDQELFAILKKKIVLDQ